ncbi:MAG: serine/threonine protein kinase [Candidatus Zixiibacteriota bacterium]|nr:MAG: serine/threonine protein kinase [candidate division Zixibacteria bacterium]
MEIRQVSHYNLFEKIGEGVSGVVYKAWDNAQQKPAAVKILRESSSRESLQNRLTAAKALVHQTHPNLVGIYQVGEADGSWYVASELIDGVTLREVILNRRQSNHDFLDLACQIAEGLKSLHAMKLAHGNLKPTNIMIDGEGGVKLLDAGLSIFTGFQHNPDFVAPYEAYHYLSPEQLQGKPSSPESDMFSTGTVFYQFLSGELPFSGINESALCDSILSETPDFTGLRKKDIQGDVILVLEKLLAKDPGDRLGSSGELLITLKAIASFHEDHERPQASTGGKHSPRQYLSLSILFVLLIVLWYVVTTMKH